MEAPYFTEQLRPQRATDGERVVLTCRVTGRPTPDIHWYHNNKNVDSHEDYIKTYDRKSGHCKLVIAECFPEDSGSFKCLAVNDLGQNVTLAQLLVMVPSDGYTGTSETSTNSDDQIYRRSKNVKNPVKNPKTKQTRSSLRPPASPERKHSVTLQLPPKKPPREEVVVMVDIPQSLTRQAESVDVPQPIPITMSTPEREIAHKTELITKVRAHRPKRRRRRPTQTQTQVSELNRPARTMSLELPNARGEQRRFSETVVVEKPPDPVTVEIAIVSQQTEQKFEPQFTKQVTKTRDVSQTTDVSRSDPQVIQHDWSHIDEELRRQEIERQKLEREREIRETILKARAEMSAEQTTRDETVKETTSEPIMEIEEEKSVHIRSYGVLEDPSLAPAQFVEPTRPQVVREGQEAVFSAIVKGNPHPKIRWLKDRRPITIAGRISEHYDLVTKEYVLTISNVSNGDQGNYTCQATNPISRANSTSNLVVVRKYPMI